MQVDDEAYFGRKRVWLCRENIITMSGREATFCFCSVAASDLAVREVRTDVQSIDTILMCAVHRLGNTIYRQAKQGS